MALQNVMGFAVNFQLMKL